MSFAMETLDVMRLHAKMDRQHYADLVVEEITTTKIKVTKEHRLPALDHHVVIEELKSLGDILSNDVNIPEKDIGKEVRRKRKLVHKARRLRYQPRSSSDQGQLPCPARKLLRTTAMLLNHTIVSPFPPIFKVTSLRRRGLLSENHQKKESSSTKLD